MKTRKRKRSTKAALATEALGVDVVVADTPLDAEPVVDAAELSPAAVEALVAEPVVDAAVEAVAAETVVEEAAAELVDTSAETVVAEIAESVDVGAETVVAEAAALVAGEPLVVLAANCSVKDAAALKVSLCAIANESIDVTLDVSAVERVDTATMQLLCAFVRDRSGRQQNVLWRGESQAVQDAVRLLGIGTLLGLESKGVAA
jgi:ABC-type transporter Mla MlaB component